MHPQGISCSATHHFYDTVQEVTVKSYSTGSRLSAIKKNGGDLIELGLSSCSFKPCITHDFFELNSYHFFQFNYFSVIFCCYHGTDNVVVNICLTCRPADQW